MSSTTEISPSGQHRHEVEVINSLEEATDYVERLETALMRTVKILGENGVQVLVDFDDMIRPVLQNLEHVQRKTQVLSGELNQMHELMNTSQLITSSLDLKTVLEEVMDSVIRLTGAERAYIMLSQGDSEDLRVQAARNADQQSIADDVTFSKGIIQSAIKGGIPIVTTNAQGDERFAEMKSVVANDLRSVIIVPLKLKSEVVGVLYADNRMMEAVFTQDFIPMLQAFAAQAAIAISNARIFEQVKHDLQKARQEVRRLQIEIDKGRLSEKVSEITESDYFQDISQKAKEFRNRYPKDAGKEG